MTKFSIVLIAKNEEKTLPRLLGSLQEFRDRGGEVVLVDTGSTDNTVEVARSFGANVTEVGEKFIVEFSKPMADMLNDMYLIGGDKDIVHEGDKAFDYSAARNYAASLASNDMISMPDCDEAFTVFNIDEIEKAIDAGIDQLEYNFVFSHDSAGNADIKFMHSKFYNRKKMEWKGVIHEVLQTIMPEVPDTDENDNPIVPETTRMFLYENIILLEHFQNQETNRSHYLTGLALDVYLHQDNDRNSHYFGRELMYNGRFKSAIKELMRHMNLSTWRPEIAQSMIFIGDCQNALGNYATAVECYHQAFQIDGSRREALIRLADQYYKEGDHQKVACYAAAAMQIPWSNFYANIQSHYTTYPDELMYWATWYLGRHEESKQHFDKVFAMNPTNSKYLHDYQYYHPLPKVSIVLPTMGRPEGLAKALASIEGLNYPKELIETIVIEDEPRQGVPKRVNEGVARSTGNVICFASNDIEFTPDSLILAIIHGFNTRPGLVAFNTGPVSEDEGNICEHFIIWKDFIPSLDKGQLFDEDFHHVGVDNYLWAQMKKAGFAVRADNAIVRHNHFSKPEGKTDEVYNLGWSKVDEDRAILKQKLDKLNS